MAWLMMSARSQRLRIPPALSTSKKTDSVLRLSIDVQDYAELTGIHIVVEKDDALVEVVAELSDGAIEFNAIKTGAQSLVNGVIKEGSGAIHDR